MHLKSSEGTAETHPKNTFDMTLHQISGMIASESTPLKVKR